MSSLQSIVDDEIERLDYVIKAAENWSKQYSKDPDTHAKIIKFESKLDRTLRNYFKELSKRIPEEYINWVNYNAELLKAYNVNVILLDELLDQEDDTLFNLLLDPIATGMAIGAVSGENTYNIELGMTETSSLIQKAAKEYTAHLVGKTVDKYGQVKDNPKAEYRINNKTRDDIRESIRTSLSLGEDKASAVERLTSVIDNPKRASTIATTESVNAYQKGLMAFGDESGAVGKEWLSVNDEDVCAENEAAGIIDLNSEFPSGDSEPVAHPNCRCSIRLVYPTELENQ